MFVTNPQPRMKNHAFKTALLGALFALGAAGASGAASAKSLDAALDCHSNGHKFVAPLLAAGDIQSEPMHVEANSVNAFRTNHALTAYGFGVYVVLGYQANDPIFQTGTARRSANGPTASSCAARKARSNRPCARPAATPPSSRRSRS